MKFSIVIPFFNASLWIGRCLDSCLIQDLPEEEYEIILVNDGSTDDGEEQAHARLGQRPNVTGLLDRTSFSCMEYMEFASDSWTTLFYDHNFNGLLLGWIPLLQKLQLREVVILKATVGSLSEKNDGTAGKGTTPMLFPDGMQSLNSPYVEAGVGLTNILNLIRVDFMWRLTHRETARRNFVVVFGVDFKF